MLVADGVGVTTGEGDVVGTTVGLGVLALGLALPGWVLAVGAGVVADGARTGVDLTGAVGRAGGVSVVERAGLAYRYVPSAIRKMAVTIQVEVRTRRIRWSRRGRRSPARSAG